MAMQQIRGSTQIIAASISLDRLSASVQSLINSGIDWKASVRAASTANITLTGTQTIDGVALSVGDRVLVKNQTAGAQNGIYVVASGAWTRPSDADGTNGNVSNGLSCWVSSEGTANSSTSWVLTTADPITVGTTALTFTQSSGLGQIVAGNGLTKSGNTISVNPGNGLVADGTSLRAVVSTSMGLFVDGTGIGILLPANSGLITDSSGLYFNAGNGIQKVANSVAIKLDSNPGLAVAGTGLKVALDTTPGLQLSATGLSVLLATNPGLSVGASGVTVKLDSNPGLQLASGGLSVKLDTLSQLVLGTGGLKVTATPSFTSVTLTDGSTTPALSDNSGRISGNLEFADGKVTVVKSGFTSTFTAPTVTTAHTWTLMDLDGTLMMRESWIRGEVPTGTVNGSNTTFTLANTPNGEILLYQNGIRLKNGVGNDYTLSGVTVTFLTAPSTGDAILCDYVR